jgi:quinol monooxygenase YgiN
MAKVAVTARVRAKEGRAEELIAAFGALLEQVESEPGRCSTR